MHPATRATKLAIFVLFLKEKSAYLLCSIVGGHYFSNGNKRLGVAILLFFLMHNNAEVEVIDEESYQIFLAEFFPHAQWEENSNIPHSHALFLYNLALVIADRERRRDMDFSALKKKITSLCGHLYRLS